MTSQIYKKTKKKNVKKTVRFVGLGSSVIGILFGLYVFFPLLSWELYIKPVFASSSYASPIPKNTVITKNYLKSLVSSTGNMLNGIDYNNATNWLPPTYKDNIENQSVTVYSISIPKIDLENLMVSAANTDLTSNLVHFPGTAIPPQKGTAAIFGHSTLPQLFDRKNYKTIFANIHEVQIGDEIIAEVNKTRYKYKIFNIEITDPEDTSYLTQTYDASYIYIITCTPPGTTWKRLIVKARLERS
ncbi:MAG TPA: sortase [Candidatus Limnocylindrales bacterium]|nr:sortase [Candidatus Limnocylindrales bacterium]